MYAFYCTNQIKKVKGPKIFYYGVEIVYTYINLTSMHPDFTCKHAVRDVIYLLSNIGTFLFHLQRIFEFKYLYKEIFIALAIF